MYKIITLLISILIYIPVFTKAQDSLQEKSHFQVGVTYLTNNVYLGRKDSTSLPYVTPSIGYFDKSGFNVSGSFSYAPSPNASRIDLFTIEAGYDFKIKDKFNGGFYIDKYFFNDNSYAINSEISAGLGAYGSYDFGLLTVNGEVGTTLGAGSDFIVSGGLSHLFSAMDEKLSIEPTVKLNASSQHFYESYYKSGRQFNIAKGSKKKSGSNPVSGTGSGTITTVQKTGFSIMDYEITIPITYETSSLKLAFIPTYAIPVSHRFAVTTGATTEYELFSNTFFASFEIAFKFGGSKKQKSKLDEKTILR